MDTVSSSLWAGRVVYGRLAVVVRVIPVRAPLPGIPLHVTINPRPLESPPKSLY